MRNSEVVAENNFAIALGASNTTVSAGCRQFFLSCLNKI